MSTGAAIAGFVAYTLAIGALVAVIVESLLDPAV